MNARAEMEIRTGRRRERRALGALVAAITLVACVSVGALVGCIGSAGMDETPQAKRSSMPAIHEICAAAAAYVAEKHPIGGPYAVNLPAGMTERDAQRVLRLMKDPEARILTAQTQSLPIIHVDAVGIVGDSATARVFRPVGLSAVQSGKEAPIPTGPTAITQVMEVKLSGGLRPWHVTATRGLQMGAIPPPQLNIFPLSAPTPAPAPEPAPTPAETTPAETTPAETAPTEAPAAAPAPGA